MQSKNKRENAADVKRELLSFSELMKDTSAHIPEALPIISMMNQNKYILRHIMTLLKIKDKESFFFIAVSEQEINLNSQQQWETEESGTVSQRCWKEDNLNVPFYIRQTQHYDLEIKKNHSKTKK